MALTQRLQMRQSQALVMTPQLLQAIKLLQLSHLDLATYVEAELERNPLLESGPALDGSEPISLDLDAAVQPDGVDLSRGEIEPVSDGRFDDVFQDSKADLV